MEQAWIWYVYPRGHRPGTGPALVAVGVHGDDAKTGTKGYAKARQSVEQQLALDETALYGEVIHPGGRVEVCRRGRRPDQYVWRPRTVDFNGDDESGGAGGSG